MRKMRDGRKRADDNQRYPSVAENKHLGEGERVGMRDGEERGSPTHGGESARSAAVQPQLRRTAAAHNLDVAPQDALRVAGPQGFHRCFLGREAAGKVNGRCVAAHAVGHFAVRKDSMSEPLTVALDGIADAGDVGCVQSQSDDVHLTQA